MNKRRYRYNWEQGKFRRVYPPDELAFRVSAVSFILCNSYYKDYKVLMGMSTSELVNVGHYECFTKLTILPPSYCEGER